MPDRPTAGTLARPTADTAPLKIGSSPLSVDLCIAQIRAGDHWHDNMLRLIGHWVARGWSDGEIITAAEALTLPGYTAEQTRREVAAMITGGRRKWGIPAPEPKILETMPSAELEPGFLDSLNLAMLPRRRWLLGRSLLRGHLTLLVRTTRCRQIDPRHRARSRTGSRPGHHRRDRPRECPHLDL